MKRTLLICNHYPSPENIGAIMRTMNFVRFFRRYGIVDIAYSHVLADARTGNAMFANEYLLEVKKHKSHKERLISGFIRNTPLPIFDFQRDSRRLLLKHIEENHYDYIVGRHLYSTRTLFDVKEEYKKRTIIDFDDTLSGTLYASMYGSVEGFCKKAILKVNRKLLERYEKKCLTFGAALFCSEEDRVRMNGKRRRDNMAVVPNVYHNESFENYDFGDGFHNGNTLLFVGTLNYGPNIDGLRWFIETIFPDFKRIYPDAKLLVVGRFPEAEIKQICESRDSIELYGNTPDIKDYYRRCRAVVVPLLAGGGTRIKILEAALTNRPVISTPLGAEGLGLTEGVDVLLFSDAEQFSARYSRTRDRATYNSLICDAKKKVSKNYSLQAFENAMEKVVKELDANVAGVSAKAGKLYEMRNRGL